MIVLSDLKALIQDDNHDVDIIAEQLFKIPRFLYLYRKAFKYYRCSTLEHRHRTYEQEYRHTLKEECFGTGAQSPEGPGISFSPYVCTSASRRGRFRPLRSLTRKNGTELTVQTIECKQANCKWQELHAHSKNSTRTPHAVRTHIPQVGYSFSYFDKMCERESTVRQHGTAARHGSTAKTITMKRTNYLVLCLDVLAHVCVVSTEILDEAPCVGRGPRPVFGPALSTRAYRMLFAGLVPANDLGIQAYEYSFYCRVCRMVSRSIFVPKFAHDFL